MPEHKFKVGERLFPARSVGFNVPDVAYVVVKRLRMRAGEFEYQTKSLTEPDERVVRESQLDRSRWETGPAGQAGKVYWCGLLSRAQGGNSNRA